MLASRHISQGSFGVILVASILVLERTDVEFIVEKMSVEEALGAMIVDDVVSDKFEVGVVDAEAIVGEELVVDAFEVGVAKLVGVVVEEDIKFIGPLSLCIFSISLNLFPYDLIKQSSHISSMSSSFIFKTSLIVTSSFLKLLTCSSMPKSLRTSSNVCILFSE